MALAIIDVREQCASAATGEQLIPLEVGLEESIGRARELIGQTLGDVVIALGSVVLAIVRYSVAGPPYEVVRLEPLARA